MSVLLLFVSLKDRKQNVDVEMNWISNGAWSTQSENTL